MVFEVCRAMSVEHCRAVLPFKILPSALANSIRHSCFSNEYLSHTCQSFPHAFTLAQRKTLLTISTTLVDVRLHGFVAVLGTEVALSGEEELNVVLGDVHGGGELVGGHVVCVGCGLVGWCLKVVRGLRT